MQFDWGYEIIVGLRIEYNMINDWNNSRFEDIMQCD